MSEREENTGVRLVKVPIPNLANNTLRWGADMPIIRLAEVYYMLAECDFRLGNKEKAVELFNTVRKRNFANAADPNPVTSANMDKYRILDEWSIEFPRTQPGYCRQQQSGTESGLLKLTCAIFEGERSLTVK